MGSASAPVAAATSTTAGATKTEETRDAGVTAPVEDGGTMGETSVDAAPFALPDGGELADFDAGGFGSLPTSDGGAATERDEPLPHLELPLDRAVCPPASSEDLHYVDGDEFWLGSQTETLLRVNGFGYFASRDEGVSPPAHRYGTTLALSVRPDGMLEDRAGFAVLGYSPSPDDGDCLTTLRAPVSLPARPTTTFSLTVNLDRRVEPASEAFDTSKPASSAIAAPFSLPLVDADGGTHSLALYFESYGAGAFRYHVLAPSGDLYPGATGFEELGYGDLQFDDDGALLSRWNPSVCANFVESIYPQCFTLDFGPSIAEDGGDGILGSTSLASATVLTSWASDGYRSGTSTKIAVEPNGSVSVWFDNGQSRVLGVLTLARFPNEDQLAPLDDMAFRQTTESGAPAFDRPGSPGRGAILR